MIDEVNNYKTIQLAQQGDKDSQDALVQRNIALVKSIAGRFINRGIDYEDLLQIGCIGLVKAIQKFDVSFEVQFSTYAVPMIMGEIKRFLRDNGSIKVSRSLKEIAGKAIKAEEDIKQKTGRDATIEEIANHIGIPTEDVLQAMEAIKSPISLDEAMYDDGSKETVLESLTDNKDNPEAVINSIMLKQMLLSLGGRDRQIIVLRYFYDKTQSEIARHLNISQVQVSRLENRIIKQLKSEIQ